MTRWAGHPAHLLTGVLVVMLAAPGLVMAAPEGTAPSVRATRLQQVVERLRDALQIADEVLVDLVAVNPRVASVQPIKSRPGAFLLSVQADFLDRLDEDELEAMVAHELGHVWIYTHHPYLQTEQLANRVAMRRVSRRQLERVYEKLWSTSGYTRDLAEFLGVAPATADMAPAASEGPRP